VTPGSIATERQIKHWLTPKYKKLILEKQALKRQLKPEARKDVIDFFAKNDIVTIPLVGLPIAVAIASAALYANDTISSSTAMKDLTTVLMYVGAYLGIPGLLVEFIVREREDKLRTVLTIMGCDFKAYWIGTFIADFILMSLPVASLYLSWLAADMSDFTTNVGGLCWFIILIFTVQLISFSYVCSYIFTTPKSAIAFMPMFIVLLLLTPMIFLNVVYLVFSAGLHIWTPSTDFFAGVLLWGIMLTSPHGALFAALLDVSIDLSTYIPSFPPCLTENATSCVATTGAPLARLGGKTLRNLSITNKPSPLGEVASVLASLPETPNTLSLSNCTSSSKFVRHDSWKFVSI